MQTAKNAAASAKEAASNVAASTKSGMDKTKATMQEKGERMTAHDPMQKEMATEKKEQRINKAEWEKQEARDDNVAQRQAAAVQGTTGHSTGTDRMSAFLGHGTGEPDGQVRDDNVAQRQAAAVQGTTGHSTGTDRMSAFLGHGTGEPDGQVTEGVAGSHPTGTGTTLGGHNTGYGTGR